MLGNLKIGWILFVWFLNTSWCDSMFVKTYEEIMASHRYMYVIGNGRNILLAFLVTVDILGIISKFNKLYFLKS